MVWPLFAHQTTKGDKMHAQQAKKDKKDMQAQAELLSVVTSSQQMMMTLISNLFSQIKPLLLIHQPQPTLPVIAADLATLSPIVSPTPSDPVTPIMT
jgi:hypothetical protein